MVKRLRPREEIDPINPDLWYCARDLARRWAVHEITVWKWASNKTIPKPTHLGPNTSRWRGAAILRHEAALAEAEAGS